MNIKISRILTLSIGMLLIVSFALLSILYVNSFKKSNDNLDYSVENSIYLQKFIQFDVTVGTVILDHYLTGKILPETIEITSIDVDTVNVVSSEYIQKDVSLGVLGSENIYSPFFGRVQSVTDKRIDLINYENILFSISMTPQEYKFFNFTSNFSGFLDNHEVYFLLASSEYLPFENEIIAIFKIDFTRNFSNDIYLFLNSTISFRNSSLIYDDLYRIPISCLFFLDPNIKYHQVYFLLENGEVELVAIYLEVIGDLYIGFSSSVDLKNSIICLRY
jgi:hypothetical protein